MQPVYIQYYHNMLSAWRSKASSSLLDISKFEKNSVFFNYFDLLFEILSCKNKGLKSEDWHHFQKMNRKGI